MTDSGAAASLAVQRRRESRREEFAEQARLAEMLAEYLDPKTVFWSALENRPISWLSGLLQKRRGARSGLADLMVIASGKPIFVELKSSRGVASKAQKQVRAELISAGAEWWMARSARVAMMALHLSGVVFGRPWEPPQLEPWEGPFANPNVRLPQAPKVAAQRRAAQQAWRERQRACKTAKLAAQRDDAAGDDIAA
jgi:hypothetical protein